MTTTEERINQLLGLNGALYDLVDAKFESNASGDDSSKSFFTAFAIGKAYKTHKAVILLCQQGYGEDAFMLSRTLFELMVITSYILQDTTEERLTRYMDYDWVTRKEMYDYFLTNIDSLAALNQEIAEKNEGDTIAKVQSEYQRVMEKHKYSPGKWSDKNIREMSESVGVLSIYRTVYKTQCTIGHTNARSMNDYVTVDSDGGMTVNVGPNWDLVGDTLVVLFHCLFFITKEANQQFSWNIEGMLKEMEKRFSDEVGAMNRI